MFHRKMVQDQIASCGVRLGDSCSIFPSQGKKKAFTLNRHCIDLISSRYRPDNLSLSYVELPNTYFEHFHYRLELDPYGSAEGRFILRTLSGRPFWLNGLAAREAYIERQDRLFLDDNKINFNSCDLRELTSGHFDHEILLRQNLISSDLPILIEGETGTGKTDLARKIHARSCRPGAFVGVNLSSFNSSLIESELFGHKKGAFTGALNDKVGAFSAADNGTLFLDEIDSLPVEIQIKLLTFLDNRRYRRVGDTREEKVNTRLIFASGRKLCQLTEQGSIRKDFFFRLKSGHTVELKALRNDTLRIKEACQYFALKNSVNFTEKLVDFYQTLAWPGNLRQLFGHLEKKKVLSRTVKLDFDSCDEELLLQSSDLMSFQAPADLIPLEQHKSDYLKKALGICEGNVAMAARKLRVSEKTVRTIVQKS